MIKNINPAFGEEINFHNTDEMLAALKVCGYYPADGELEEGSDFEEVADAEEVKGEEVTQVKAHTWEQERAAVVAWLAKQESHAEEQGKTTHDEEARLYLESRLSTLAEIRFVLEDGEHWTEGGKVTP